MLIFLKFRSVFILNGNGADVAKHCIPGVPAKRWVKLNGVFFFEYLYSNSDIVSDRH